MRKAYFFVPVICGLLLAACDDDDETEPNPTLTIAVGDPITLVQGQTGSTTITVTRGGGYDDEVDLSVSNLPVGVTAAFEPAQIPAGSGQGTSTLTLTADATTVPGTAQFVVEAEATTRAGLVANATGSVTVNEAPGFSLALDPTTLEIAAGGEVTSDVAITRTGGFAEAVTLTVANLPTGVTATFDNAAPTGDAAVLTLTADETVTPGPATTITVTGTGTPGTATADIALTVTEPPAGFSIALDPAALSIAAGATGTSTVNVTRTGGFIGAVALTATGAPDGVTIAFDPASADASSTATVTVASTVAAGNYPITIAGNAEGQTEKTATLTLTVTAPSGSPPLANLSVNTTSRRGVSSKQ